MVQYKYVHIFFRKNSESFWVSLYFIVTGRRTDETVSHSILFRISPHKTIYVCLCFEHNYIFLFLDTQCDMKQMILMQRERFKPIFQSLKFCDVGASCSTCSYSTHSPCNHALVYSTMVLVGTFMMESTCII